MSGFEISKQHYIEKHNASLPVGITHDDFRIQKFEWVREQIQKFGAINLLDFGFGAGELIEDILGANLVENVSGVDPSAAMRESLRVRVHNSKSIRQIENDLSSLADGSLDMMTCFNVLHHVAPANREMTTAEMMRKLKPGGRLLIWEHNPFNLATQFIVCRCEYDRDAILIRPSELRRRFGNLVVESFEFVNISPPKFHVKRFFRTLENSFAHLPLGAQYRFTFRKPI